MIPDPTLGIQVDFPEDQFRNAIKFAMQMGSPNLDGRQISFVKKGAGITYFLGSEQLVAGDSRLKVDRDGRPLNPEIRSVPAADTIIDDADCAIEITPADANELPVGKFRPVKATVTLLDVDYAKIKDCRELHYNGDRYQYGYEPEDDALFAVDVHSIIFYALDES